MDDSSIISLFNDREESAIAETNKKYRALCVSVAKNILSDSQDIEECLNDAYLAVWKLIPPQCPERFAAFLCRIVKNLALKKYEYIHAAKRAPEAAVSFDELDEFQSDSLSIESDHDAKELSDIISSFLLTEKKLDRVVFVRRYWFYDSTAEIAKKYRLSESAVKAKLMRTRQRLKKHLIKEGFYHEQ